MHINLGVLGTQSINFFRDYSKRCAFPIANNESIVKVGEGNVIDIMLYVSILTNEIPTNDYEIFIRKGSKYLKICCIGITDFKSHKISNDGGLEGYKFYLLYSGIRYNIKFEPKIGVGEYMVDLYEANEGKSKLLLSTPIYVEHSEGG